VPIGWPGVIPIAAKGPVPKWSSSATRTFPPGSVRNVKMRDCASMRRMEALLLMNAASTRTAILIQISQLPFVSYERYAGTLLVGVRRRLPAPKMGCFVSIPNAVGLVTSKPLSIAPSKLPSIGSGVPAHGPVVGGFAVLPDGLLLGGELREPSLFRVMAVSSSCPPTCRDEF